jgi:hypothetical protein
MIKIQQNPRAICDPMKGQNYWFNGCMEFLVECIGESKNYDYWFFSGITGDSFIQIYCKNVSDMVFCYSDRFLPGIIKNVFDSCGYNFEYFNNLKGKNHETHDATIREYINTGIPVIAKTTTDVSEKWTEYCCIYGYDDEKYYAISGNNTEKTFFSDQYFELIFVKEKKEKLELAAVYKNAVMNIPLMISLPETNEYAFGKKAFSYWADSFQNSTFSNISGENNIWYTHPAKDFSCWNMHGNYLCMLGTNNCAISFLEKALQLNPDMVFINDLIPSFKKINGDGFHKLIGMVGGFQLKPNDIKNKVLMKPVTEEINILANYCDDIVKIFNDIIKRTNGT